MKMSRTTQQPLAKILAAIGTGEFTTREESIRRRADRDRLAREDSAKFAVKLRRDRLSSSWSTIPRRFWWANFDESAVLKSRVSPSSSIDSARSMMQPVIDGSPAPSIVFFGESGAGKTSLTVACLRLIFQAARDEDRGKRGGLYALACGTFFAPAFDIARARIESPLGSKPAIIRRAIKAKLLVIDDLGTDLKAPDSSRSAVSEIIHHRHSQSRPTIITTYLRRRDIVRDYGAGIDRRMYEGYSISLSKG